MRKIIKSPTSQILTDNLQYDKQKDKSKILAVLEAEQQNFCAYTEERFTASYSRDIEHFNPTLKDTPQDSYENWFAASTKFNKMKGTKNADSRWQDFQPLILPTHTDLEKRVLYDSGHYIADKNDQEAQNLIVYLNLNFESLVKNRQSYISVLKDLLEIFENNTEKLQNHLIKHPEEVRFPTAVATELGIMV